MKRKLLFFALALISMGCSKTQPNNDPNLTLWYDEPAKVWIDAFPQGNGKLASMCFGDAQNEHFQINEESLWAGRPSNPYAENYRAKLDTIQRLILEGQFEKAHEYGLKYLIANPTSFRSYEPLGDLLIDFDLSEEVSNYKRELDLSTGICTISFNVGDSKIVRESFISAIDNALCIRITASGDERINCNIALKRVKDAVITAMPNGSINMDGQIVDDDGPKAYEPNPGGSGPGGAHMGFASRLKSRVKKGAITTDGSALKVTDTKEVILYLTAATDYNLSKLNFDKSIDPALIASEALEKIDNKSWKQIKKDHIKDHSSIFNRVSLDLGASDNESLPTDERLLAFKNGSDDPGVVVQLFQFGRYLLMNSSRAPAILPANLQGKWSGQMWASWEADYHLNINLQMNYWLADLTNMSETYTPLINWFEIITENSKPLAQEMFGSDGWFSCHAVNPFGRVTPSASSSISQFNNGSLDPLAGAWMVMNLWDHYTFTQDKELLRDKIYPMLNGASEFILDYMVEDDNGTLHLLPSSSPENLYRVANSKKVMRITSTSTYHLSIIMALFKATKEASEILGVNDGMSDRIKAAERKLPSYLIDSNGRITEWREERQENEPGHRHLSHLLGIYPFDLITPETPELYKAAQNSLAWRQQNGQGGAIGWAGAHSLLMHARFKHPEDVYYIIKHTLSHNVKTGYMNNQNGFQIDANLGLTSGIAEILIQSHRRDTNGDYIIELLPALPTHWSKGSIDGICTRGAFVVDMSWDESKVTRFDITAREGGRCTVIANDEMFDVALKPGETATYNIKN